MSHDVHLSGKYISVHNNITLREKVSADTYPVICNIPTGVCNGYVICTAYNCGRVITSRARACIEIMHTPPGGVPHM